MLFNERTLHERVRVFIGIKATEWIEMDWDNYQ